MPKKELTNELIESLGKQKINVYDTIQSGLILRVSKNGTKSFSFRYKFSGKVRRFTFGRYPRISISQARENVRKYKNQVIQGIDPQKKIDQSNKPITFSKLAEIFKKKHFIGLRESSKKKYRRIIDNDLLPHFKNVPIRQISKKMIIEVLDSKAYDEGSPTQANNMRARLHTMFNFAVKRNMLDKNIIHHIDKYRAGINKRERFYSENEIRAIWQYLPELEEPTKYIFMMLFLTGQRKGETRKMRWNDINFQTRVWTIPTDIAKNNTSHRVPLSTGALWILEHLRSGFSKSSQYVFPSRYKSEDQPIWKIDASSRLIKKNVLEDFRPHDIRRTVATHLAKLKVDRTGIGKILNHKGLSGDSTITAIYDRYSYEEEKREALQIWSDYLNKIISS